MLFLFPHKMENALESDIYVCEMLEKSKLNFLDFTMIKYFTFFLSIFCTIVHKLFFLSSIPNKLHNGQCKQWKLGSQHTHAEKSRKKIDDCFGMAENGNHGVC